VKRRYLVLSLAGAIGFLALNGLVTYKVLQVVYDVYQAPRRLRSVKGIWKAETKDGEYYLDFSGDGRVVSSERRRLADGSVLEGGHSVYSYEFEDAKTVSIFGPGFLWGKSLHGELRLLSKDEMLQSSSRDFAERVRDTAVPFSNSPLAARSDVVYKRSPN
jgi:hypothetical protein